MIMKKSKGMSGLKFLTVLLSLILVINCSDDDSGSNSGAISPKITITGGFVSFGDVDVKILKFL